ncbi:hypothetical protein BHM03_00060789 [Ensete ventricosum]|nr:hypothetical protein BHM03_00060789 [Ensete ventricosum]
MTNRFWSTGHAGVCCRSCMFFYRLYIYLLCFKHQMVKFNYFDAVISGFEMGIFFHSSVAVMTRAFPVVSGEKRYLVLLQEISSYLLLACGLTYVISVGTNIQGALCIGFLKRSRQHQETTREQAARDLEIMLNLIDRP